MDGGSEARRITIHGEEDFPGMRAAGQLAARTLDMIAPHVVTGVTTAELDRLCHEFILAHGAVPAPLNYRGFPKSICTSINHVVCHGIPGEKKLAEGDIVNIDVTVILDGWHGDTSRMYGAGALSTRARNLLDVTYQALMKGVDAVKPGATLGDLGHAIQTTWRRTASAWCATSAATASAAASMPPPTCCISAAAAKARCCGPGCSSPSSRWSTPAVRR